MKRILIAGLITMFSFAQAQTKQNDLVFIGDSEGGKIAWYGASTTFKVHNDGFSMMVIQKNTKTKETVSRLFVGVMAEHCKVGYGSLKARENIEQEWKTIAQFSVQTNESVADIIALTLCEAGHLTLKDKVKNNSNI